MTLPKEPPRAPVDRSEADDEKPPNRRRALHFDARDVLAGRLDDATVSQAVEARR